MKATKRFLGSFLAAVMTFTSVFATPATAEESKVSAYASETFIDIADVYNETRYLSNGYDLGGGISIYIASTVADLALKAGWANTFTDGQAVTHRFVLTEGNSKILDLRPVGTTISVSNIDRAIKIDAPSAGKVTFYADVNERGYTSGKAYLVNSSGEIVSHITITSFQSYIPQEVTIPEAGTYYYVVPNRICEMNIAAVRVSMESSGSIDNPTTQTTTETTTESTTKETTTETTTESTTKETTTETTTESTTKETTTETTTRTAINVYMSPDSSITADVGDKVIFDISTLYAYNAPYNSYNFYIKYDPQVLELSSVDNKLTSRVNNNMSDKPDGSSNSDYAHIPEADGTRTAAQLGYVFFTDYIDGNGSRNWDSVITTLEFTVKSTGNTDLAFVSSGDGFNAAYGQALIKAEFIQPNVSILSKDTPYDLSLIGDVNMDKSWTSTDAANVMQKSLDSTYVPICESEYPNNYMYIADVDGDKILTSKDAAYIIQYSLDSSIEFPIIEMLKNGTY